MLYSLASMAYLRATAPDEWLRQREAHKLSTDLTVYFEDLMYGGNCGCKRLRERQSTLKALGGNDWQDAFYNAFFAVQRRSTTCTFIEC